MLTIREINTEIPILDQVDVLVVGGGPAGVAAALAAAGEGFTGSWRTSKRWTSRIATPTMAALALQGMKGRVRAIADALIYVAVMVPGIVIGIATLIALVSLFGWINPLLATLAPEGKAPQLSMGYASLIAAHALFSMALVIIILRARLAGMDRSLMEASADLYAPPLATFRQVTLPLIFPGILAGFLLSFTFSFDDFIIAFFVAGSETTLPIYVFSSIRRGVTPEINAIGTMVLTVSLLLLVAAQIILRRGARPGAS